MDAKKDILNLIYEEVLEIKAGYKKTNKRLDSMERKMISTNKKMDEKFNEIDQNFEFMDRNFDEIRGEIVSIKIILKTFTGEVKPLVLGSI